MLNDRIAAVAAHGCAPSRGRIRDPRGTGARKSWENRRKSSRAVFCTRQSVLARLRTAAVFGVEACPVHVEVDVAFGFPSFTIVGLPDASVRESRDRVRSAIRNSGFEF